MWTGNDRSIMTGPSINGQLLPAGAAPMAIAPAAIVPVATEVGGFQRHGDRVEGSGRYVSVAARTQIGLVRVIGLNVSDFGVVPHIGLSAHDSADPGYPKSAHRSRPAHTTTPRPTYQ